MRGCRFLLLILLVLIVIPFPAETQKEVLKEEQIQAEKEAEKEVRNKDIVGRVEKVRVYPGDLALHAKLDTGAKTSSLHASSVTKFQKNGEAWVRFCIKGRKGEEATIERKIVRQAKIKQQGQNPEKRPVVMLGICMGRQYREVEVNLVDRGDFNYPLLIGRTFMIGHFVVDPELKYTAEPACVGAPIP